MTAYVMFLNPKGIFPVPAGRVRASEVVIVMK
jgi:hypothetical protein